MVKKKKISELSKRFKNPEEHAKNISKGLIKFHKENPGISPSCGKKLSEERKKKISLFMKERFKNKENHPRWKGGKFELSTGYVVVNSQGHPNAMIRGSTAYMLEHRLVMEKKIGRYLERWETVHHINRIRNDNRIENLELLPNSEHWIVTKLIEENKRLKQEIEKLKKELQDSKGVGTD